MEKSKADPCVFREVVVGEITLIVCGHREQESVRCIFLHLLKEFAVNNMGDLSYYVHWVCVRV